MAEQETRETLRIRGVLQWEDGTGEFTREQADDFLDKFIDWVEANGLGFGGIFGLNYEEEEE